MQRNKWLDFLYCCRFYYFMYVYYYKVSQMDSCESSFLIKEELTQLHYTVFCWSVYKYRVSYFRNTLFLLWLAGHIIRLHSSGEQASQYCTWAHYLSKCTWFHSISAKNILKKRFQKKIKQLYFIQNIILPPSNETIRKGDNMHLCNKKRNLWEGGCRWILKPEGWGTTGLNVEKLKM